MNKMHYFLTMANDSQNMTNFTQDNLKETLSFALLNVIDQIFDNSTYTAIKLRLHTITK